jgi:hypothetical protein
MTRTGDPPTDGDASDPWAERLRRGQSVAERWLAAPGVLPLLRDARDRLGAPGLDAMTAISAVAEIMDIELVVDAEGGLAERYFSNPLEGGDGTAQAQARATVVGWVAAIDAVTREIAALVPSDAPFEAWRSRLTIAELLLTGLDLEGSPAQVAAAMHAPPTHVALGRLGAIDAAWFADDADVRFGRRLGRAFRPRRRRTATYRGGQPRRPSERAVRARAGVRALLDLYPTITAHAFEPHWRRLVDAAPGDLLWAAFAGAARWTPADGRYTQAGFARLLREVRAARASGPTRI